MSISELTPEEALKNLEESVNKSSEFVLHMVDGKRMPKSALQKLCFQIKSQLTLAQDFLRKGYYEENSSEIETLIVDARKVVSSLETNQEKPFERV